MLESELLREDSSRSVDLSEMWFIRLAYREKAEQYVRTRGRRDFAQGGELQDVLQLIRRHGAVPRTVYDGTCDHAALLRAVHRWAERTVRRKEYENPDWQQGLEQLLDKYMGPAPDRFDVGGVRFSPRSFADSLGIRPERYLSLTSFLHHPYYEPFVLELPDNWMGMPSMNIPPAELVTVVHEALSRGYTVGWNTDISNPGFHWRAGVAEAIPETDCTAEERQRTFDEQEITDDHIMHIIGLARNLETGQLCYKVKNSWGADNRNAGFIYVTENYLKRNTIDILVPCDALPQELLERCSATRPRSYALSDINQPESSANQTDY